MVLQAEREIKVGQEIDKLLTFEKISAIAKVIEFGAVIAGLATKTGEGLGLALIGGTVGATNLLIDVLVLKGSLERVLSISRSSDSKKS